MQSVIQKKSYNSVQIFWLNKDLVEQRLNASVERLVRANPEVEKIVLFGSLAEGRGVTGSDIDVLIIVDDCQDKFINRSLKYVSFFSDVGLGADIFVYTKDEVAKGIPVAETALKQGKVLFERIKTKIFSSKILIREKNMTLKWIECWRTAGPELEMVKHEEIRKANTAHAIRLLDDAFNSAILQYRLKPYSGLVEQQRLFKKLFQRGHREHRKN